MEHFTWLMIVGVNSEKANKGPSLNEDNITCDRHIETMKNGVQAHINAHCSV